MWGGTPNRPAMGPEHPVAGPGRWGTERPAANRWGPDRLVEPDRADAGDGRHALDRDAALTPIFTALRRGRWRRPRDGRSFGTAAGARAGGAPPRRPADVPDPGRPGPALARPVPDGRLPRSVRRPCWVGRFPGVDPHASGGFRGAEPQASGRFREVEPYASSGFRWPVVAPSASGGHRAVSVDLHTWGGERSSPCRRRRGLGRVASDARPRRVGRSVRPGLVRPARGPAVADGDDGRVVPGGLLDAAPAGDRHGPPPPPPGPRRLVTASRYVRRREWARLPARVGVCRRVARLPAHRRLIAICARGAGGDAVLRVFDRGRPLLGR